VLAILLLMSVGTSFASYKLTSATVTSIESWVEGFWLNFSTEMMGAVLTFLLIEIVVHGRDRREETMQRQLERDEEMRTLQSQFAEQLKSQLRLPLEGVAVSRLREAQSQASKQAILDDMTDAELLVGARMPGLDLRQVELVLADMRKVDLSFANLRGAQLVRRNLTEANLESAKLGNADFFNGRLL